MGFARLETTTASATLPAGRVGGDGRHVLDAADLHSSSEKETRVVNLVKDSTKRLLNLRWLQINEIVKNHC